MACWVAQAQVTTVCKRMRKVDITEALLALPATEFLDSGGTNGWLAHPEWLKDFVDGLALDGKVKVAVLRMLPSFQGIPLHTDFAPQGERRFHVPLVTHPAVAMRWPDARVDEHLESGYLWFVDHTQPHEVIHKAPINRVHVQIDLVGCKEACD